MERHDQDQQFLTEVFQEMTPHLVRYALASLNDWHLAEDAVQEVFRIACDKFDDLKSSPNYKGWLVNTLKYVLKNYDRLKQKDISLKYSSSRYRMDVSNDIETHLDVNILYGSKAIEHDLKLLERLHLNGETIKEIAESEEISVETGKKRIQRARKRLRKFMEETNKE